MNSISSVVAPGSDVTLHEMGDEAVLFLERTGRLLRLNPTAALVWRGLEAELSVREIAESLAAGSGVPADDIERDLQVLVEQLRLAGALSDSPSIAPEPETPPWNPPVVKSRPHGYPAFDRSYRLVDFQFRLRMPDAVTGELAHAVLGHLERTPAGGEEVVMEVIRQDGGWILLRDGEVLDECAGLEGIAPMLHANVLLTAYWSSGCVAAIHAAAVTRGGDCILMPAVSGSGKTTLTTVLLAHGFGYCTDDLALLDGAPLQIRAVGACLGLKRGAWPVLAEVLPEIERLPIHVRADGKEVRYLPPPPPGFAANAALAYSVHSIVFPTFEPASPLRLQRLSSAEGLTRLTEAGYDMPRRLSREAVEMLIGWISDLPCYELRYGDLDDAVAAIEGLLP